MASHLEHFLSSCDWNVTDIKWFSADWSVRNYARLTKDNGESAILLKSPPDDSPDAMVGHLIGEWSSINKHFRSLGLNVPEIIAENLSQGLILMSDFGDETIAGKGIDAYLKATDILIQMRDHKDALSIPLKRYKNTHVYKALRFFPQYVCNGDEDKWFNAWQDVENNLPPCPRALTHIDYAPQNLMWNDGEIGIIDFQAACDGPFVYDLVNLLEDIRIDVPTDIRETCKNHYYAQLSPQDKEKFDMWYPVITAQFYARILGQIQFLAQEKGRDDLMVYYNPLMKRFEQEIEHPLLSPIKGFIEQNK